MKKTIYIFSSILLLTLILSSLMFAGIVLNHYVAHTYPNVGTITEINKEDDSVIFEDAVGFEWSFYGIEDWEIGDTVVVIMYDCETEDIRDDRIMNKKYSSF